MPWNASTLTRPHRQMPCSLFTPGLVTGAGHLPMRTRTHRESGPLHLQMNRKSGNCLFVPGYLIAAIELKARRGDNAGKQLGFARPAICINRSHRWPLPSQ